LKPSMYYFVVFCTATSKTTHHSTQEEYNFSTSIPFLTGRTRYFFGNKNIDLKWEVTLTHTC